MQNPAGGQADIPFWTPYALPVLAGDGPHRPIHCGCGAPDCHECPECLSARQRPNVSPEMAERIVNGRDVPCEACGRPWPVRMRVGLEHGKRGCWSCQNDWLDRSGIREPRARAEWTVR